MSIGKIIRNSVIIAGSTTASALAGAALNNECQSLLDRGVAVKKKGFFGGVKYTTVDGKKLSKKTASEMQYQLTANELIRTRVGVGVTVGAASTLGAVGLSVGGIKAADAIGDCARKGMVTIAEKRAAKKLAATEQAVEQPVEAEVVSEEEVTEE